jgi:hypothetical protein
LHRTKWRNGKKKKEEEEGGGKGRRRGRSERREKNGSHSPQKNSMQDSEGIEENTYPVPDPNKTMTNDTKEHSDAHKTSSKKKSCKESLRISWRRY